MEPGEITDLARQAIVLTLTLAAPVLLTGLVVALAVSIFQAATQVQEHTLSFVPKIVAMLLALLVVGPWIAGRLVEFGRTMFGELPW